jgi:cyclopropane-fatty-acyl-phospholipid synthase
MSTATLQGRRDAAAGAPQAATAQVPSGSVVVVSGVEPPEPRAPFRAPRGRFEELLHAADIRVIRPGEEAHARAWDVVVRDARLESRVRREGLVGLGDAYVDGWWECAALDQMFDRALRCELPRALSRHPRVVLEYLNHALRNQQNRRNARRNVEEHYNLGNDVFESTLDPYMQYTCGYWKTATDLTHAQEDKLELICRKLGLRPGMTLLDLGCGWGGLMRYAAEKHGVRVTGVTLSVEQLKFAEEFCAPVKDRVEFRFHDYRDTRGKFDRVTSIGMFEHVGPKNLRAACEVVHRCVSDDGLALIQFFGTRDSFPNRTHSEVAWINKHIFPGLVVPSLKQIGAAVDNLLVLEDLHNFGAHYDPTLMGWAANFERNWPKLADKYGERFGRVWRYYLLSCAGAFRARQYQLWQLVFSRAGVRGGYQSVR